MLTLGNPYLAHNILVGKDYVYAFILAAFPINYPYRHHLFQLTYLY